MQTGIVQQVCKVLGGKQDRPIGDLTLLFHVAHTLTEQLILGLLLLLRLGQLHLLLGNKLVVFGDLSLNGIDFRLGRVDLLLQQSLLLQGLVFVFLDGCQLILQLLLLIAQIRSVILQFINFRLSYSRSGNYHSLGHQGDGQGQHQSHHQQALYNCFPAFGFLLFHCLPPVIELKYLPAWAEASRQPAHLPSRP